MLVKMHRMKLGIPHIIYMMVTMSTVPTLLRYGHDNMVSVLIIPMSNKKGLREAFRKKNRGKNEIGTFS